MVQWLTLHFHCMGDGFNPWSGKFHMPCRVAPPKIYGLADIMLGCEGFYGGMRLYPEAPGDMHEGFSEERTPELMLVREVRLSHMDET